jgi:3-isopropylmalate/(R)-2-methylmalate dehydratase large subunit
MPVTLFDKIWDSHVVAKLQGEQVLLHIDRHFILDLGSNIAFEKLAKAGRKVRNPGLTYAVMDHTLATTPGRDDNSFPPGAAFIHALRRNAREAGIRLFDVNDPHQGIVHVVAAETGAIVPGCTMVAGDSHTSTAGGLGALGFGIGTSEVEHVLATQTLVTRKPKRMRIVCSGRLKAPLSAKDLILYLIGRIGTAAGTGFAVEYAGEAVRALPIEARLTLCNMSIEFGARVGMVAPDETTFSYLAGREFAPKGAAWDAALRHWKTLPTDDGAAFDEEIAIDAAAVTPQVTWGTSPEHVAGVDARIPDPATVADPARRAAMERALGYMGLQPGVPLEGLKVDWAFIGSCANSRLSDLEAAAAQVAGRRVASHVRAVVVPGSTAVKRAAEAKGLDKVFLAAGFEWRESACSFCASANADQVGSGERCISTSNRNFEGRQGTGARTHLASPAMVAAAAVAGCIADVRKGAA